MTLYLKYIIIANNPILIRGDILKILNGIKPESVFGFFEEISSIPRGSGNTQRLREYCEAFAEKRGLRYISDDAGNIVIFKPASDACSSDSPVIIQGHLDMVWEKDEKCTIDFNTDGLELEVNGDFISAKGTTLGGDDGIAVAMCLALLDSRDICHPPLEVVFTADEETGMFGASALDCSYLKSKRMINLDSEAEGTLWVSCAGGLRADIKLPVEYEENHRTAYAVSLGGLHGGHSGTEIHKGYANANKLLAKMLSKLGEKTDFGIIKISGGTMDNAITREALCVIAAADDVEEAVKSIADTLKAEYPAETDMLISVESVEGEKSVMTKRSTQAVIGLLNELPNGVIAMSAELENFVETSLNLGILKTEENTVSFGFALRSGVDGERDKLAERLKKIADKYFCSVDFYGEYPAWEYKKDSQLRETMSAVYKEMFNADINVTAIHAGLECGIFCGKIKELDCVSLGPDMLDIHTPSERLSISSTERVWNFLLCVLERI